MAEITFEQLKNSEMVNAYLRQADSVLAAIGYTEHCFTHAHRVAASAGYILSSLCYPARQVELAKIAAYLHDIGNLVNRADHAHSGALLADGLLDKFGMDTAEKLAVISAIGHHDEPTAAPVSDIAAALIIADKSDVRRSRVRGQISRETAGIHERVNYSVTDALLHIDAEEKTLRLSMQIDTKFSSVMEYFEVFLSRMELCRRACQRLGLTFCLRINGQELI